MMGQAIRFADVQLCDVVCRRAGEPFRVTTRGYPDRNNMINLQDGKGHSLNGHSNEILGLLHRPVPEGENLVKRIEECAEEFVLKHSFSFQDKERTLAALRRAMDAYELNEPLAVG